MFRVCVHIFSPIYASLMRREGRCSATPHLDRHTISVYGLYPGRRGTTDTRGFRAGLCLWHFLSVASFSPAPASPRLARARAAAPAQPWRVRSVEHLPDGARERDDVADVAHRCRVEHEALEANAEARVRLRAEAARVEVGGVVLLLKPTRDCPRLTEMTRDYPRLPETTRDYARLREIRERRP